MASIMGRIKPPDMNDIEALVLPLMTLRKPRLHSKQMKKVAIWPMLIAEGDEELTEEEHIHVQSP